MEKLFLHRFRLAATHVFGFALALELLRTIFPEGYLSNQVVRSVVYWVMFSSGFMCYGLLGLEHVSAGYDKILCTISETVFAIMTPVAITLLVPSIYAELHLNLFLGFSPVFAAAKTLFYWTTFLVMITGAICLMSRVMRWFFR